MKTYSESDVVRVVQGPHPVYGGAFSSNAVRWYQCDVHFSDGTTCLANGVYEAVTWMNELQKKSKGYIDFGNGVHATLRGKAFKSGEGGVDENS